MNSGDADTAMYTDPQADPQADLPKDLPAAPPAGGDDTSLENILKTLQKSLVGDDDMLKLIPDVYKSKGSSGSSGKDLVYTDKNGNNPSLTSENPSIQYMIEEFNKITDQGPAKQFYLALSRNIQKNFDLSDKNDKNDKNTLLLRLRKNSLLLQLPPFFDYVTMQQMASLNLLEYTKLSVFNAIYFCKKYDYNDTNIRVKYSNDCTSKMEIDHKTKKESVTSIFTKYNTDPTDFWLFNIILEIIDVIVNQSERMKVFKSNEFNKGNIVDDIDLLVTKFNFKTFSIQNFPFPYLNIFIETLSKLSNKVIGFYTWLCGSENDKKVKVDIQNYIYLVFEFASGSGRNTLPFVSIAELRFIFSKSWIKIPLLLTEIIKNLKKYTGGVRKSDIESFIQKANHIKESIKKIDIITGELDMRRRMPMFPLCDNILKYLETNENKLYDKAINYEHQNMIDMDMVFSDKNTTKIRVEIQKLIKELKDYNDDTNENIVCIKFIVLLLFIKKNISISDMDTGNLQILFHEAMNILITINNGDKNTCMKDFSKLKIYEFVKLICDIFIFIIDNEAATNSLIVTGLVLKNSLSAEAKAKYILTKERKINNGETITNGDKKTKNTERNIPNLIFIVKNLDDIIKTCTDPKLQTIFNKFKDNLTYTSVTEEDIDNFKSVTDYLNYNTIMCKTTSGHHEKNKTKEIISNADDVKEILDYLKRYSSPSYIPSHVDVDVGVGGGKKHRKRYIKNKQNNNKNDNITMKKNRRNRKRAPVMKTIRNKKEQE